MNKPYSFDDLPESGRNSPEMEAFFRGESGRLPPEMLTGRSSRSEAAKGVLAALKTTKAIGHGLLAYGADIFGADEYRAKKIKDYQSAMEESEHFGAEVPDITRARSMGEVMDWFAYYIPNAMTTTLPTVAAGGVPAMIVKAGGKKFVEKAAAELVKKGINATAAKELAQAQLAKRVRRHMTGSAVAGGTAMGAGSIYGETEDVGVTTAHAPVMGLLEAWAPLATLKRAGLGNVAMKEIGDSVTGAITGGALKEAGTEGLQSLVEQHANYWVASNGESLLANMDAADWRGIVNGALAGAGSGGTFSGVAEIPNAMERRRMNNASDESLQGTVDGFDNKINQLMKTKNEAIAAGQDTKILSEQIDGIKRNKKKVEIILADRKEGITIPADTELKPTPLHPKGAINLGAAPDITSPYNQSISGAAQSAMKAEADKGGDALTQAIAGSRAAGAAQEANADRLMRTGQGYQATGLQQQETAYGDLYSDPLVAKARTQVEQQIAELDDQFNTGNIDFEEYADMTEMLDAQVRMLEQQATGEALPIQPMAQPTGVPGGTGIGEFGTGLGVVPQGTALEETLRGSTGTGAKGVLARRELANAERWLPTEAGLPAGTAAQPTQPPVTQEPAPTPTPTAEQPKPQLPQKKVPYSVTDILKRHKKKMVDKGYDINWRNAMQGKGSEARRLLEQLEERSARQQLSQPEQEVLDVMKDWKAGQPEVGQISQPIVTGAATGELTLPKAKPPKKPPEGGTPAPAPEPTPEPEAETFTATHTWEDPDTGYAIPVQDIGNDTYLDEEGNEFIGEPEDFTPLAGKPVTPEQAPAPTPAAESQSRNLEVAAILSNDIKASISKGLTFGRLDEKGNIVEDSIKDLDEAIFLLETMIYKIKKTGKIPEQTINTSILLKTTDSSTLSEIKDINDSGDILSTLERTLELFENTNKNKQQETAITTEPTPEPEPEPTPENRSSETLKRISEKDEIYKSGNNPWRKQEEAQEYLEKFGLQDSHYVENIVFRSGGAKGFMDIGYYIKRLPETEPTPTPEPTPAPTPAEEPEGKPVGSVSFSATHYWEDPETGEIINVENIGDVYDMGEDVYVDKNGEEYSGGRKGLPALPGVSTEKPTEAESEEEFDVIELEHLENLERKKEEERLAAERKEKIEKEEKERKEILTEEEQRGSEELEKRKKSNIKEAKAKKEKYKNIAQDIDEKIPEAKELSRELEKGGIFKPLEDPVPWDHISKHIKERANLTGSGVIPWARELLKSYSYNIDSFNDKLIYADENISIFSTNLNNKIYHYVVRQPDAAKFIAWARVSGKKYTSPAIWNKLSELNKYGDVEGYIDSWDRDSYDVVNTNPGNYLNGLGYNFKGIKNTYFESDLWKRGWRGSATRVMRALEKQGIIEGETTIKPGLEQMVEAKQAKEAKAAPEPAGKPEVEAKPKPGLEQMVEAKEAKAAPTAREERKVKRKRKLVEIDENLEKLSEDMAAIFKEQSGRISSGVDPVIMGKLLITGVKTSVALMEKGAIKFADWADNMLYLFERQGVKPEQAAPYLKGVYLATGAAVDDVTADAMDSQKTVRAFDVDSLIEAEPEQEPGKGLEQMTKAKKEKEAGKTTQVTTTGKSSNNLAVFDQINLNRFQEEELRQGGKGLAGELDPSVVQSLLDMRNNPNVPVLEKYESGGYRSNNNWIPVGNGISINAYNMGGTIVQKIKLPNGMTVERTLRSNGEIYGEFSGNYEQIVEGKGYQEAMDYINDFYAERNKPEPQALPTPKPEVKPTAEPGVEISSGIDTDTLVNEYHMKEAEQAFQHSSRYGAKSHRDNFVKNVQRVHEENLKNAKTDKQKEALGIAIRKYKQDYLSAEKDYLRVREGVASYHIAGSSKFNSKQAESRGKAADKALETMNNSIAMSETEVSTAIDKARTPDQKEKDTKERQEKETSARLNKHLLTIGEYLGGIAESMRTGRKELAKSDRKWSMPKAHRELEQALDIDRYETIRMLKILDDNSQDVGGIINIAGARSKIGIAFRDLMKEAPVNTEEGNVPGSIGDLERNSSNTGTQAPVVEGGVQNEPGTTGQPSGGAVRQNVQGGIRPTSNISVPENSSTTGGEPGNQQLLEADGTLRDQGSTTESGNRNRGSDSRREGTQPEARPDQDSGKVIEADGRPTVEQRVKKQKEAEGIASKDNNIDNIRDTLPVLMPEQQDDILFAEKRLLEEGKSGVLFTNGTGTGKTFTGLGMIKRFARTGKDNILIIAPNDKVANDWIASGKLFGLDISKLKDTKSAGTGIVIGLYQNVGKNNSLVKRNWDMVVSDESHKLMEGKEGKPTLALKTLRGITMNPYGSYDRYAMLNEDEINEYNSMLNKISNLRKMAGIDDIVQEDHDRYLNEAIALERKSDKLKLKLNAKLEIVKNEVSSTQESDRPKVVFLSATPFAYRFSVGYADGYLLDMSAGRRENTNTGYNVPSNEERFYIENFGYRMRYNKLTEPDKDVDIGLMEREFNQRLKDSGALRGRRLEVDSDYSRQFVLIDDAIGRKIDEGISFIRESNNFSVLWTLIEDNFNYLEKMKMLEAIKARHAIERIKQHQELGRKVVIFHNYKIGGTTNPFAFVKGTSPEINKAIDLFNLIHPELANLDIDIESPIVTLQEAFPDLMLFNGDIKPAERQANVKKFNDDKNDNSIILIQRAAGKEGISLQDTTGANQRILIDLGLPGRPTDSIQTEGRIYRVGQKTDAVIEYFITGTTFEKHAFATTVATRASTAENLALGHEGRKLLQAFVEGFRDGKSDLPSISQGKGGKENDRSNSQVSDFDRAKNYYYARQKRTSKNKSAEGKDYFATPEPVGLVMVGLSDVKRGESMLEPSAGHGAIARFFPEYTYNTMVEQSYQLSGDLGMVTDGKVLNQDFEALHITNKYHSIVMNPPFGTGGKMAEEHVKKAMIHLKDGGRIVALIPSGPAADKRFEELNGSNEAEHIYQVAEIKMPAVTFERAGTKVMTRIVVWEKQKGEKNADILQLTNRDYSDITSINDLFDNMEGLSIQPRLIPEPVVKDVTGESLEVTGADENKLVFYTMDSSHTKTGKDLFVVNLEGNLSDDQYQSISKEAKKEDGFYIKAKMRSYYKPKDKTEVNGKPTFTFNSEEQRQRFLSEIKNILESESTPETDIPAYHEPKSLTFGEDMNPSTGMARMGRQGIEKTIKVFQRKYPGLKNLEIRVLKDTTELPQLYKEGEELVNRDKQGAAFIPGNNTVYIFADNVHSPSDINKILQHESFAHFAIDSLPVADRDAFIEQIHAAVQSDPELMKIWEEVSKTYEGYSRRTQAEEVVARIAEDNPAAMKALRRLWWKVRQLYRKYFDGALPVKHWEVEGFVSEFARRVKAGTYQPSASESRNYGALPEGSLVEAPAFFRRNSDGSRSFRVTGSDPEKIFSAEAFAENDLIKGMKRSVMTAWAGIRKGLLPSLGGRQITDVYAKYLDGMKTETQEDGTVRVLGNPVTNYQSYLQNMQALANNKTHDANDIDIEWGKLATKHPKDYETTSEVMHEATIYEIRPDQPFESFADTSEMQDRIDSYIDELSASYDVEDEADRIRHEKLEDKLKRVQKKLDFELERERMYPILKEKYESLHQDAKDIYKKAERFYEDMWQETHDALIDNVMRNMDEGRDRAAFLENMKSMFMEAKVKGPYFPLKRFGQYYAVALDSEGERYREHFETAGQLDKGLEDLRNGGFTIIKSGMSTDFNGQDMAGVSQFAGNLHTALGKEAFANVEQKTKNEISREINQVLLQMLPDISAAKGQLHRSKVKGYSENARRSFAFTTIHSANRLARITYADRMMGEIRRIEKDIDSHNTEGVVPDKDIPIAAAVVNEMKERHETIINPKGSPLASHITNAAFVWYLGASLGAGLVNLTQTPLMAIPIVGSRFGYGKAGKAFLKAAKDFAVHGKKRASLRKSAISLGDAESGLTAEQKSMMQALIRDGTIETTQAHSMSGVADTDVKPHMQKGRERIDKVMRVTGFFFHNAEVANREITALATYRLARETMSHDESVEVARKAVFDSHFDYSGANRPRVMKNNWLKVFLIFKQYSQNMTYTLLKNATDSLPFRKLPKADKKAARKALAGILLGHATMAGTLGLPLVTWIGPAIAAAFGDEDDEYRDWQTMYRNWLADLFGKDMGYAIAKGPINALTGKEFSSRVSLSDLWIRSPNYEMSAREESMHYMMQALGPAVGGGLNFILGVDQVAQGQTLKGMEKMVPKFIRDGIRSYRYSTEGATVGREGYQAMIEDFSLSDIVSQAAGISPASLSEAYSARSSVMNMGKRIQQARGDLLSDYYRAYRDSDYDAMGNVLDKIHEFNSKNPMFRIRNLGQSIKTRRRYEQQSESGIYLPNQKRGLLEEARYAL